MTGLRALNKSLRLLAVTALIAVVLLVTNATPAYAAGTYIRLQNIVVNGVDCNYFLQVELDMYVNFPGTGDTASIEWYYGLQGGPLSLFPFTIETVGPGPTSATSHENFTYASGPPQPPNTQITFEFRDANSDAEAGLSVDCTTGNVVSVWTNAPGPGPDLVPIPDTAVVGSFVQTTPAYFAPQSSAATDTVMEAGKTAWVYGVDASGQFYKVMLAGKFFWVPVNTMGPNYDEVWNGTPLPTNVVS